MCRIDPVMTLLCRNKRCNSREKVVSGTVWQLVTLDNSPKKELLRSIRTQSFYWIEI